MSADTLTERLRAATTEAMRARDRERLGVLRLLGAAIKQHEVDSRAGAAGDEVVLAIFEKQIKQRRESLAQYEQAGREDLASVERYEIGVIETFMPAAASDDEIAAVVEHIVGEVQPAGMRDMGKVMAGVKTALAGRADMGAVSRLVKARLAG